jgi:putative flavoprotein involved in K+ transport
MANYQRGKVPAFATQLADDIMQMHSEDYRNLVQLKPGGVLLVGAGNSGADIAIESATGGHPTWVSGPDTGAVPFRPESFIGRKVLMPLLLRGVFHRVLTLSTPLGRKARPKLMHRGVPLIRVKPQDLARANVVRVPRVVGVRDGRPLLADESVLDVANVIWCSGFDAGFEWIDLPIFDSNLEPVHRSGVVSGTPGLYFVGLTFLHAMSSSMIHGVGRDAARIVRTMESQARRLPRAIASLQFS